MKRIGCDLPIEDRRFDMLLEFRFVATVLPGNEVRQSLERKTRENGLNSATSLLTCRLGQQVPEGIKHDEPMSWSAL